MIGWKRIVITVGEKIGKTHLTYAQGASAELVAAGTIGAADVFGLPVSTTHVLSSGVAGTMAANGSGLQMATVRNLLMAWVLTLPAAICLSASLTSCSGRYRGVAAMRAASTVAEGRNQTPAFCFPQSALTDDTAGHHVHTPREPNLWSWSPP